MTELDKFKQDYRPKEGYSFTIFAIPNSDKFHASVFKKVAILSRVRSTGETEEDIAECNILNISDKYENFVKALLPYIDKI